MNPRPQESPTPPASTRRRSVRDRPATRREPHRRASACRIPPRRRPRGGTTPAIRPGHRPAVANRCCPAQRQPARRHTERPFAQDGVVFALADRDANRPAVLAADVRTPERELEVAVAIGVGHPPGRHVGDLTGLVRLRAGADASRATAWGNRSRERNCDPELAAETAANSFAASRTNE